MPGTVRLLLRIVSLGAFAAALVYELQAVLAGEHLPGFRWVTLILFIGVAGIWQMTAKPAEPGQPTKQRQTTSLGDIIWRSNMAWWFALGVLALGYAVYALIQGAGDNAMLGLLGAAVCLSAGTLHLAISNRRRSPSREEESTR